MTNEATPPGKAPGSARRALGIGLLAAMLAIGVDQAHKLWMIYDVGMQPGERFAVTPFLDIHYVVNRGISYGLFQLDTMQGQYLLAGISVLVAIGLLIWLARDGHSRMMAVALGLVVGGALGNAIDRVHLGGVADFFALHAFGFSWYIFNIADVAIVAGIGWLLYDLVVLSRNGAANRT